MSADQRFRVDNVIYLRGTSDAPDRNFAQVDGLQAQRRREIRRAKLRSKRKPLQRQERELARRVGPQQQPVGAKTASQRRTQRDIQRNSVGGESNGAILYSAAAGDGFDVGRLEVEVLEIAEQRQPSLRVCNRRRRVVAESGEREALGL